MNQNFHKNTGDIWKMCESWLMQNVTWCISSRSPYPSFNLSILFQVVQQMHDSISIDKNNSDAPYLKNRVYSKDFIGQHTGVQEAVAQT